MNTLEDAFVNIGLNEDIITQNSQRHDSTAIQVIPPPPSNQSKKLFVFINCVDIQYKFSLQFSAMFMRKYYGTIRSPKNLFLSLMPLVGIILSTITTPQIPEPIIQLMLFMFMIGMMYSFNASVYSAFPVLERQIKLKQILMSMGCKPMAYWIGMLAFDLALFIPLGIILIVMGVIMYVRN